jgi:hypothetical protein
MLIFHRRQLEVVLAQYVDHYNGLRPHRSIEAVSYGASANTSLRHEAQASSWEETRNS